MALWGQNDNARYSAGRAHGSTLRRTTWGNTVVPYPRNKFRAGQSTKVQLIKSLALGTWANTDSAVLWILSIILGQVL